MQENSNAATLFICDYYSLLLPDLMKTHLLAVALLFATQLAGAQTTSTSLDAQAMSAYEAKDYGKAGQLIDQALRARQHPKASDYYNAACMWAMAGNADKAFGYLSQANKVGYDDVAHLRTDSDLINLHPDRRWQPLLAKLDAAVALANAHVNLALQKQLAEIRVTDQRIRLKIDSVEKKMGMEAAMTPALTQEMQAVDERNLAQLVAIINQYGWPGRSLVGKAGATTAFLVIQHADPATQQKYLPLLRTAATQGELEKSALALLEDRVLMGQGKPQIYGSQLTANMDTKKYELYTIEDEAHVDKRRAAMGLEPLADYAKRFGLDYQPKK
jgi:hypothetical protein